MRALLHTLGKAATIGAVALLWSSCGEGPTYLFTYTRFAMDTVVEYTIAAHSPTEALVAADAAHEEIERIERLLWEGSRSSEIARFNDAADSTELSAETAGLLSRSVSYAGRTGGAFDITVKPVLDLYGFGGGMPHVPVVAELNDALTHVNFASLRVDERRVSKSDPGLEVAVGGVAKGYAIDRAVAVLRKHGIKGAIVNAGGDLYCLGRNGERPWRVGVRHPDDSRRLVAVVEVADAAVATSGDYERFFVYRGVRYHHIVDPKTGRPARGLRSATVVAPSAEEADAFATGVFVLGSDRGLSAAQEAGFEALVVDSTGAVALTPNFPGRVDRLDEGID